MLVFIPKRETNTSKCTHITQNVSHRLFLVPLPGKWSQIVFENTYKFDFIGLTGTWITFSFVYKMSPLFLYKVIETNLFLLWWTDASMKRWNRRWSSKTWSCIWRTWTSWKKTQNCGRKQSNSVKKILFYCLSLWKISSLRVRDSKGDTKPKFSLILFAKLLFVLCSDYFINC